MIHRERQISKWCRVNNELDRLVLSIVALFVTAIIAIYPLTRSIFYLSTTTPSKVSTDDSAPAATRRIDLGGMAEGVSNVAAAPVVLAISGIMAVAAGLGAAIVVYLKTKVDQS